MLLPTLRGGRPQPAARVSEGNVPPTHPSRNNSYAQSDRAREMRITPALPPADSSYRANFAALLVCRPWCAPWQIDSGESRRQGATQRPTAAGEGPPDRALPPSYPPWRRTKAQNTPDSSFQTSVAVPGATNGLLSILGSVERSTTEQILHLRTRRLRSRFPQLRPATRLRAHRCLVDVSGGSRCSNCLVVCL